MVFTYEERLMARLENVIFCLTATRSSNQISANNIMAVLTPEYIPGLFSFSVILTVLDVEPNSKHMIYVKFIDQHQDCLLYTSPSPRDTR